MKIENLERLVIELNDTKEYIEQIIRYNDVRVNYETNIKDVIRTLNNLMNAIFNQLIS